MLKEKTRQKSTRLEKSKRITPREVLRAYRETTLAPITGMYLHGEAACAVGALGVASGHGYVDLDGDPAVDFCGYMKSRMPDKWSVYLGGFEGGFDGHPCPSDGPIRRTGWRDGRRAARFVAPEDA